MNVTIVFKYLFALLFCIIWDNPKLILYSVRLFSGEPNNAEGNEYCVEIGPQWNDKWNDHTCADKRGFICEKPCKQHFWQDVLFSIL